MKKFICLLLVFVSFHAIASKLERINRENPGEIAFSTANIRDGAHVVVNCELMSRDDGKKGKYSHVYVLPQAGDFGPVEERGWVEHIPYTITLGSKIDMLKDSYNSYEIFIVDVKKTNEAILFDISQNPQSIEVLYCRF